MIFSSRYIRLLTSVLEWQQQNDTHRHQIQVKCEETHIPRHHMLTLSTHQAMRMRARLRRTYSIHSSNPLPVCDKNGNNLLMIAPNNHLPLRKMVFVEMPSHENCKRIKVEEEEKTKEEIGKKGDNDKGKE